MPLVIDYSRYYNFDKENIMKYFVLLSLLGLLSCQESSKKDERPIEKVGSEEDEVTFERQNFVLQTNIKGLSVSGDSLSKQGNLTVGENISVIDSSTSESLDEFPMLEWGPVGFSTDDSVLRVFPKKDVLVIEYKISDKNKIIRTSKCTFAARPDSAKFQTILASTKSANPDWEGIFSGISQLAFEGDKRSYDFFMNPDAEAKSLLKNSDGAASTEPIVKVLKFMKANGCSW